MEILPSYEDAISGPDWLDLVAAYVPVVDWPRCCLVDQKFHRRFAPRLWQDPLVTVRRLGLHPNDDLAWYRRFINKHIKASRLEIRTYVRALDFRSFASRASGLYSSEASERAISESFKHLPQIFPGLICLLVDGHPELNPESLATAASASESLRLLDLARCRHELTPKLFSSYLFRGLVYLDISFIPGSVKTALQSSLNPSSLPELRVLKVAGREMDNSTAGLLFQTFRRQLWSLDLSHNKLGDEILDGIVEHCVSLFSFHTDAHFEEGRLIRPKNIGSRKYGPFGFIGESGYSHHQHSLEKYLADSPFYSQEADETELQEWQAVRPNGNAPLRRDDANTAKESLLDEAMSPTATRYSFRGQPGLGEGGLTHLCLNGNKFTLTGIARLLRTSRGRLEHFECDSCLCTPARSPMGTDSKGVRIVGFPDSEPLFRPVISSAIRSLRIHHSLVTQIPSLSIEGVSSASAARLAEELSRNIRRAYPLAFTPDTNPRITSVTLTNIPARSTGPVIDQLVQFLDLASAQQRAIGDAKSLFRGRVSSVLKGLRHIRLELGPDFSEGTDIISTSNNVDFDKLLDPAEDSFSQDTSSFFDSDDGSFGVTSRNTPTNQPRVKPNTLASDAEGYAHWTSGRLKSYPYSDIDSEYMTQHVDAAHSWTGNVYSVPVWIGPGVISPHAAVNEYMWNIQDANLRADIGPATPNHVAAGVPPLSYVFYAAWEAMVMPRSSAVREAVMSSSRFRDVATAIKEYRLRTRGTADHWDGKLELVRTG
ncbi:hypothetical protein F4804DRAFT_42121 [Jackrogersella minutella]|nr:hypothetical protein F4804DRAFT_42121 [Jackrogersella minutella]